MLTIIICLVGAYLLGYLEHCRAVKRQQEIDKEYAKEERKHCSRQVHRKRTTKAA